MRNLNNTATTTVNTTATAEPITKADFIAKIIDTNFSNKISDIGVVTTKVALSDLIKELASELTQHLIHGNFCRGYYADGTSNIVDLSKNPQCWIASDTNVGERIRNVPALYAVTAAINTINIAVISRYDRGNVIEYISSICHGGALTSAPQLELVAKKVSFNRVNYLSYEIVTRIKGYTFSFGDVVKRFPKLTDSYKAVRSAFLDKKGEEDFQGFWNALSVSGNAENSVVIQAYQQWSAKTQKDRKVSLHNLKMSCGAKGATNAKSVDEVLIALLKYDYSVKGAKKGSITLNESALDRVLLTTIARAL